MTHRTFRIQHFRGLDSIPNRTTKLVSSLAMLFVAAFLLVSPAPAQTDIPIVPAPPDPNIIGIADNATACGGAVLCSTKAPSDTMARMHSISAPSTPGFRSAPLPSQ
jgi:hypothetical protein